MLADEIGVDFVEELPGFPGHYLVQTSEITEVGLINTSKKITR